MRKSIALCLAILSSDTLLAYSDVPTHSNLTSRTLLLVPQSYRQVHQFGADITRGAVEEDQKPRYLNHFWDPTTGRGLPQNWYTLVYEGQAPRSDFGSSFRNAFDWALSEMPDHYDWNGSIVAYGNRDFHRAYVGLGHVLHLLQDLGQPDHSKSRPHPGNYLAQTIPQLGIRDVGYEGLWAQPNLSWPPGTQPVRYATFEQTFLDFARIAQQRERAFGLPMPPERALGLASPDPVSGTIATYTTTVGKALGFTDHNWEFFELHVPIIPIIPLNPNNPRYRAHLALGQDILPRIEEHGAGLLMLFYEIVNSPPFIQSVEIKQDGATKYKKSWRAADRGRSLVTENFEPLKVREPATIEVFVGPDAAPDPNVPVRLGEPLNYLTLTIRSEGQSRSVSISGAEGIWVGTFIPTASGTLEFDAMDADPHYDLQRDPGDLLDSDPSSPAVATPRPNYVWNGYQPGADTNHSFTVTRDGCDRKVPTYGLWEGEVKMSAEEKGFGLMIGGKVFFEGSGSGGGSLRFKSLADTVCGGDAKRVKFGGKRGQFSWEELRKENVQKGDIRPGAADRVTVETKSEDEKKSDRGPIKVDGYLDLESGDYSFSFSGSGEAGVKTIGGYKTGRGSGCEIPELSGTETHGTRGGEMFNFSEISWSARLVGEEHPPHEEICFDCSPGRSLSDAIRAYAEQVQNISESVRLDANLPGHRLEDDAVSSAEKEFEELSESVDVNLESAFIAECERAADLWVEDSSDYVTALNAATQKKRELEAIHQSTAARAIDITQRLERHLRNHRTRAKGLKALIRKLETEKWRAFGA